MTGFNDNAAEGLSQAVATIPGHEYQLSYFIGNTNGGGIFGSSSSLNLLINGAPISTDTNSNADLSGLNWEQFTHTFIASGASTTIELDNEDPPSDNSNGLDNVVLLDLGTPVQPGPSVPEPSSAALLGVLATGMIRARRRR